MLEFGRHPFGEDGDRHRPAVNEFLIGLDAIISVVYEIERASCFWDAADGVRAPEAPEQALGYIGPLGLLEGAEGWCGTPPPASAAGGILTFRHLII